ncbi:MAG: DMT family transporter [Clostridia bacterium]|nr:DMT family transporter [Clostridia bacterium]
MSNSKNTIIKAHILMIFLVMLWGFDYVVAKFGMYDLTPNCLLFARISIGAIALGIVKVIRRDKSFFAKKDIPLVIACSIFGEILYFECEFNAMSYLPVSLLTILLAFVPALSVLVERVVFKRKANKKIIIGIIGCIVGIVFVIGADFSILLEGRLIGYLIAFGAVICWNIFNFLTDALRKYDSISLAFLQLTCAGLILLPLALRSMPALSAWPASLWAIVLYMGIVNAAIGFVIYVFAIKVIGPTPAAIYSDFMPVSTAICGVIFLHETITPLQIVGGIIVVAAGYIVIREKGKLDEERLGL